MAASRPGPESRPGLRRRHQEPDVWCAPRPPPHRGPRPGAALPPLPRTSVGPPRVAELFQGLASGSLELLQGSRAGSSLHGPSTSTVAMFWELGRRLRLPEWAAQEMSHCGARKVRPRDGRGPTTPRAESGGSVCPEPGPGPHPWADVCVQGGGRKLRQQLEAQGRPRPQRKCVGRGGQSG